MKGKNGMVGAPVVDSVGVLLEGQREPVDTQGELGYQVP